MSSHKIPAVQRCPHCIFLMFSSFSTRLPETPVSIIGNIHLVKFKKPKAYTYNSAWFGYLPKVWKSSFRLSSTWRLIKLLCNEAINFSLGSNARKSLAIPHISKQTLHTFGIFDLAFGLPLLRISCDTRRRLWWWAVFLGRQRGTFNAFNTLSLWWGQRWAIGMLSFTPGTISSLAWIIFLSIPRIEDRHWEGQTLLDGPPPAGRL